MKVTLDTTTGKVTLTGQAGAVRDVVENDLRARMFANRDSYSVEDCGEEGVKIQAIIDAAMDDHNYFRGKTYEELNAFCNFTLGWADGFGSPTHEIIVHK